MCVTLCPVHESNYYCTTHALPMHIHIKMSIILTVHDLEPHNL